MTAIKDGSEFSAFCLAWKRIHRWPTEPWLQRHCPYLFDSASFRRFAGVGMVGSYAPTGISI